MSMLKRLTENQHQGGAGADVRDQGRESRTLLPLCLHRAWGLQKTRPGGPVVLEQGDFLTAAPETGLGTEVDPVGLLANTYSVCANIDWFFNQKSQS